jgi:hypothetical protein
METEADKLAWKKYIESCNAHFGHDEKGQGSPITEMVLQYHSKNWDDIFRRQQQERADKNS